MKNFIKYILQKSLGLQNYLYLFARYVIFKVPYDKNERSFLKFLELFEDGGHVLDIGANIGAMSYYFSKSFPDSVVHAFEPLPLNADVLLRIVHRYNLHNVKIYSCALGDKNGKVTMVMPALKNVYFHGLSHVDEKNSSKEGNRYEVEIKRLDDMDYFKDLKITAIKIDVEEYEYHVLHGAVNIIRSNRPVIYCELWDSENRRLSLSFIQQLNYKIFVDWRGKLVGYNNQKKCQNFFFIPAEHCHQFKL